MWSNKYIRIPFLDRGRSKNGADCWGLVRIIFADERGIDLPVLDGYCDTKDAATIKDIIGDECARWSRVDPGQEMPFDVVVFKMLGLSMHIGLIVEPGLMIHCQKKSNTTHCRYLNESEWKCRIEGFYRYAANSGIPTSV